MCKQIRTSISWSSEKKKFFLFFWVVLAYLAFWAKKWGYRGELGWVFGSNVLLAVLIDLWTFHVDVLKGNKVCSGKQKQFWAKIGQNWPKSAMRIMQSLRARARRRTRGLIFSPFYRNWNFMGVRQKSHQDPTNYAKLSAKNPCPIVNANQ